jgi:hypothetical protein
MRSPKANRNRVAALLLTAVGLLAILALPGVAAAKDRNHDGIPDRWEKRHHLSMQVNQAHRDQDADHLNNMGEFQAGDNPHNADTNGDGVMDGDENAGTIASFDPATGKLTINLFNGDTVSGMVTEDTRIEGGHECHPGEEVTASGSSEGDHNSGPGDSPPAQGEDENDDAPGDDGTPPGAGEGPGQGDEHSGDCTTAALVVGATVQEAELTLSNGVATFEKIELAK